MANVVEVDIVPKLARGAVDQIQSDMQPKIGPSAGLGQLDSGEFIAGLKTLSSEMKNELSRTYESMMNVPQMEAPSGNVGIDDSVSDFVEGARKINKELNHTMPESLKKTAKLMVEWAAFFGSSKAKAASNAMAISKMDSDSGSVWGTVGKIGAGILIKSFVNWLIPGSALVITGLQLAIKTIELFVSAAQWAWGRIKESFMKAFNEVQQFAQGIMKEVAAYNPGAADRFQQASKDFEAAQGKALAPSLEKSTDSTRVMADSMAGAAPYMEKFNEWFGDWNISMSTWLKTKALSLTNKLLGWEGGSVGMAAGHATTGSASSLGESAVQAAFSLGMSPMERAANAADRILAIMEKRPAILGAEPRMPGAT